MDFDDLKAELNGQSAAETSEADRKEAEQRMYAAGITPTSPMNAMKSIVVDYDSSADEAGITAVRERMMAMTPAEVKQALYQFGAAIAGVSSLRDAVISIVMVKALQGDEGFRDLLGGFDSGAM